jgi:hypothetical protein
MATSETASTKDLRQVIVGILHVIQMLLKPGEQIPDFSGVT